jgi:hypothetical protein
MPNVNAPISGASDESFRSSDSLELWLTRRNLYVILPADETEAVVKRELRAELTLSSQQYNLCTLYEILWLCEGVVFTLVTSFFGAPCEVDCRPPSTVAGGKRNWGARDAWSTLLLRLGNNSELCSLFPVSSFKFPRCNGRN